MESPTLFGTRPLFDFALSDNNYDMTEKTHTIKINLPGGIISAGDFFDILNAAEEAGAQHIRFGNRQQLFFDIAGEKLEDLEYDFLQANITYEVDTDKYPNIVSSYVTEDVFGNSNWVREGVYKDVLDLFEYTPKLKINLDDNQQSFIPFFTGNLNFISSDISNFWFLYIRFPKTNTIWRWPVLIYSDDIPAISRLIENLIFANRDLFYDQDSIDGSLLFAKVHEQENFITEPVTEAVKLPAFQLPYYEGFNNYGNKLWLGIYRRDELYTIAFLKDICSVCLQTRVGQLYTTSWKSLVIKGIEQHDQKLWNAVLAKHRINVRHASNELNWQIEDLCEYGLGLKRFLVKQFDEIDLRTYRLCFAIKTQPKTGLFGSVIIRKQFIGTADESAEDLFDILHTIDFNPNTKSFNLFRSGIKKEELLDCLVTLCNNFYDMQSQPQSLKTERPKQEHAEEKIVEYVHQCKNCFTVYDDEFGDELNNVPAGVKFDDLSDLYVCPTCDAGKEDFILIEKFSSVHL